MKEKDVQLLIIDIQEKLLNCVFNKDILSKNADILAQSSKILDIPVIITEQYPKGLGATVENIKSAVENAIYFEKTSFNALSDREILKSIKNNRKKEILVCGIETHICVYQTVIDLIKHGFNVTVIKNACGSRDENEYNNALHLMELAGAKTMTVEMVLFGIMKGSKHPMFKQIQGLLK